ncbi:MAG: pentapeptide repeat-containing protein [Steroidobacteraceae bacterium]
MLEHKKKITKEVEIQNEDLNNLDFYQHELVRVHAIDKKFVNVSFKQSIIRDCYFRNCIFRDCDFTGAGITNSNFQGSDFVRCTFDYTTFSGTHISTIPLKRNLPSRENLKMHLAKSLRMNYASIGDYEGVTFAIDIEISATMEHLKKATFSREAYYRGKKEFSGFGRIEHGAKYLYYKFLSFLWGNGEKPLKMFISIPILLGLLSVIFSYSVDTPIILSINETIHVFFIGGQSNKLGFVSSSLANIMRYIALGLFVSSLVRRISRR